MFLKSPKLSALNLSGMNLCTLIDNDHKRLLNTLCHSHCFFADGKPSK